MIKIDKKKLIILIIGCFLTGILSIFILKSNLRSRIGINSFTVKVISQQEYSIHFLSPSGGNIELIEPYKNVFTFTQGEKKIVHTINIYSKDSLISILYSKNIDRNNWKTFEKSQILKIEDGIVVTNNNKSYFSYFNRSFNWKGDAYILLITILNSIFILGIVLILYLFQTKIKFCFSVFVKSISINPKKHIILFTILFTILTIAFYLNIKHSTYFFLTFRNVDEIPIIGPIFFNYKQFWKGHYMSMYNLLQLVVSLPGILFNNIQLAAVGNRMLSAFFACLAIIWIYRITTSKEPNPQNILYITFILTIPGFWINLNIARPEWVMTSVVLLSLLFLLKDKREMGKFYWIALATYGFSLAVKEQAIMFFPIYLIYYSFDFFSQRKLRSLIIFISILGISFFCFAFELLPFSGIYEMLDIFIDRSTAGTNLSLDLMNWINFKSRLSTFTIFYFPIYIVTLILVSHLYVIISFLIKRRNHAFFAISTGNLIVIIYNIFFSNKNWQNYYLSFMIIGCMIFFMVLQEIFIRKRTYLTIIVSIIILSQLLYHAKTYKLIKNDFYIPEKSNYSLQIETNNFLYNYFLSSPEDDPLILCSPMIGFDDYNLQKERKIRLVKIWTEGKYIEEKNLKYISQFDYIIIEKNKKSNLGYVVFQNSENVYIKIEEIMSNMEIPNKCIFENDVIKFYKILK